MTPRVKSAGITVDNTSCWKYYMDTVRSNLHVVLSFSPVTEEFRVRAKRFPALVNSTVIDWFQPWPAEALHSVCPPAYFVMELFAFYFILSPVS